MRGQIADKSAPESDKNEKFFFDPGPIAGSGRRNAPVWMLVPLGTPESFTTRKLILIHQDMLVTHYSALI